MKKVNYLTKKSAATIGIVPSEKYAKTFIYKDRIVLRQEFSRLNHTVQLHTIADWNQCKNFAGVTPSVKVSGQELSLLNEYKALPHGEVRENIDLDELKDKLDRLIAKIDGTIIDDTSANDKLEEGRQEIFSKIGQLEQIISEQKEQGKNQKVRIAADWLNCSLNTLPDARRYAEWTNTVLQTLRGYLAVLDNPEAELSRKGQIIDSYNNTLSSNVNILLNRLHTFIEKTR
jgi:hypothetical protein